MQTENRPVFDAPDAISTPIQNVWLLIQDRASVRGVFQSLAAAEREIEAIRTEHRDLKREDFVVQVERIRPQ